MSHDHHAEGDGGHHGKHMHDFEGHVRAVEEDLEYPPLYTVAFEIKDVFGGSADGKLCVDVHEEWLDPA